MKFHCKVVIDGIIHHDKTYNNLTEICNDLNLSYQQVADYSSRTPPTGKGSTLRSKFKFYPNVSIIKLPKS